MLGRLRRQVRSVFACGLRLPRVSRTEKAEHQVALLMLERFGLTDVAKERLMDLPYGIQKRVDIARALLNSPKLILADEPTGNLDPETSDEIMQLLFHISRDFGTAIVMATHDYIVINKYPARMVRTERGRVIDNATISIE